MNLAHNQMSKLPDELEELGALENLDISHNSFINLPYPVYKMPKLINLNASHNYIIGNKNIIRLCNPKSA